MSDWRFLLAGFLTGFITVLLGLHVWQGVLIAAPNLLGWVFADE